MKIENIYPYIVELGTLSTVCYLNIESGLYHNIWHLWLGNNQILSDDELFSDLVETKIEKYCYGNN